MPSLLVYAMVYLGSALMVYNIYGFVRFTRNIQGTGNLGIDKKVLNLPIVLLVFFLIGYLVVGVFGNPDLIVSGILFGGSIFVFVMYRFLDEVTRRIIENERLEAELLAAEKSSEAKSDFLANMSHEMRTPLNVILGLSGIALKDAEVPVQTHAQLQKISWSARHMLGLINNILDINRIEAGKLVIKNEEFCMSEALNQVNAIGQTQCEQKGLEYSLCIDEGVATHYVGDEMQLKEVLLSIVDNAVKYTDVPGKVSLHVEAEPLDRASEPLNGMQTVRFTISDTGVGMEQDFIPKVFEAFTKEDSSSTTRYGGGGLSLSVAKSSVDAMGGSIAVESRKNEGSTFTVVLPLTPVEKEEEQGATADDQPELADLEGRRILIVEDIEENAEIVADLLDLEGVESDCAENGQIAVEMVTESPAHYYDAVLMDLRMPVMDGLEATRQIRNLNRPDAQTLPIVALSANAFESDVNQALEAGMNAHLAKPADADMLYTTLKHVIRATSC